MGKNQRGFSIIELVLGIVAAALLVGTGLYVYQATNKTDDTLANTEESSSSSISKNNSTLPKGYKEYKTDEFGFRVHYPEKWKVKETLEVFDVGQGRNERYGTIDFLSPNGITLTLAPNFGGKGGGCEPAPNDKPHQQGNACNTLEYLQKEAITKFTNQNKAFKDDPLYTVYFVRYKFTGTNEKSRYGIGLHTDYIVEDKLFVAEANKPRMGFLLPPYLLTKKSYLNFTLTGVDNSTESVFKNPEVIKAEAVLKSFRLL